MGHAQRHDPELLLVYAEQLRQLGAEAQAEEALRAALKKHYEPRLVELYGQLRGSDTGRQLQGAEAWLGEHAEDPVLLRALARMSLHHQLWGKARDYYEASLGFARDPQTCAELARLLARLGEAERSNQLFQEGLGLLNARQTLSAPR
ncbi:putative protoheme IX biogenesis protein [compost metagenome]